MDEDELLGPALYDRDDEAPEPLDPGDVPWAPRHRRPLPAPIATASATAPLADIVAAVEAVAILQTRLTCAAAPIRHGWLARLHISEAAAAARLEDHLVDEEELLCADAGAPLAGASEALSQAQRILALFRFAARRGPHAYWTPRRLVALAGRAGFSRADALQRLEARARGGKSDGDALRLAFATLSKADRQPAIDALLCPRNLQVWREAPALLAAGAVLAEWHRQRLDAAAGAAAGLVLAKAWVWRAGTVNGLVLPIAMGFRGHMGTFSPTAPLWTGHYLRAVARGAAEGVRRLDVLEQRVAALDQSLAGRRASPVAAKLVALMVRRAGMRSAEAVEQLKASRQGVLNVLAEWRERGLAQEISARGKNCVWRIG